MGKIDLHPNENIIKAALINNYAHINSKPFVVCSELTISEESKIVDLVFCKDNLSYAYEIKAWNDDMRRLPAQLDAYCKLFDYIYVATTANHLDQLQLIPDFVGIVLYSTKTKKIVYKRRAKKKSFNRQKRAFNVHSNFIYSE
ncbi:sce7726 family protein [Odoribacter laneus]|uniref:sce7726 family protein n=1 Tax=Odoribacter laneus TaxID=626933 RepID=UPI0023F1DBF9|nr:sce7726 family protein [Odoribacter laneus]